MKSQFLGAFAKLRKVTISFVRLSVSPCRSVRMEQLDFHLTDFDDLIFRLFFFFFFKSLENIIVVLKYVTNKGYFP
jgi:hypothetical protein